MEVFIVQLATVPNNIFNNYIDQMQNAAVKHRHRQEESLKCSLVTKYARDSVAVA